MCLRVTGHPTANLAEQYTFSELVELRNQEHLEHRGKGGFDLQYANRIADINDAIAERLESHPEEYPCED